eukprot:jgi/Mesvir1/22040/Mv25763-RA.1
MASSRVIYLQHGITACSCFLSLPGCLLEWPSSRLQPLRACPAFRRRPPRLGENSPLIHTRSRARVVVCCNRHGDGAEAARSKSLLQSPYTSSDTSATSRADQDRRQCAQALLAQIAVNSFTGDGPSGRKRAFVKQTRAPEEDKALEGSCSAPCASIQVTSGGITTLLTDMPMCSSAPSAPAEYKGPSRQADYEPNAGTSDEGGSRKHGQWEQSSTPGVTPGNRQGFSYSSSPQTHSWVLSSLASCVILLATGAGFTPAAWNQAPASLREASGRHAGMKSNAGGRNSRHRRQRSTADRRSTGDARISAGSGTYLPRGNRFFRTLWRGRSSFGDRGQVAKARKVGPLQGQPKLPAQPQPPPLSPLTPLPPSPPWTTLPGLPPSLRDLAVDLAGMERRGGGAARGAMAARVRGMLTKETFPVPTCVNGVTIEKCQLTRDPLTQRFQDQAINRYFESVFEAICAIAPCMVPARFRLSRYDLFHGHLFLAHDTGRMGILFHAREYPRLCDEFPIHLGYCQQGSPERFDSAMHYRNVLWLGPCPSLLADGGDVTTAGPAAFSSQGGLDDFARSTLLAILDTSPGNALHRHLLSDDVKEVHTLYEEDFGMVIFDINYLHGDKTSSGDNFSAKECCKLFIC